MKITKIPGLGRFGHFIDDLDLANISDEHWHEIGQLHLKGLVTIIRGNNLNHHQYYKLIEKWGKPRYNRPIEFYLKYGKPLKQLLINDELDEDDKIIAANGRRWQVDKRYVGMIRVTPKKNNRGQSIGIFGDGELLWHSNESGDPAFTPGVSLMGWENMIGSCTGFCTTVDWYEKQTESFRSELDELILVHNYKATKLNPTYMEEQEKFYKNNTCPHNDSKLPLVIKSPGDIKGLHLALHTADYFDGMTKQQSDNLLEKLKQEIITEEYTYYHWYKHDRDLLIFDNSITLHNRQLETESMPNRIGYRIQFDYDNITNDAYLPFYQNEYNNKKIERLKILEKALEGID